MSARFLSIASGSTAIVIILSFVPAKATTAWDPGSPPWSDFSIRKQATRQTTDEKSSIAFGVGLDYGGFGLNLVLYPVKPVGFFGGVGYNLVGIGWNAGLKLRIVEREDPPAYAYLMAMYGYNTAIYVKDAPNYNKAFYGASVGVGFETNSKQSGRGRFSMALVLPLRKDEVDAYIKSIQGSGVTFKNQLPPVAISIGYRLAGR